MNVPQTEAEVEAIRRSVLRGCPYGHEAWQRQMAERQGLSHTLRPLERPKQAAKAEHQV